MSPAVQQLADALAAVITEAIGGASPATPLPAPPLTVPELARRYRRKPVSVRAWIEAGRFPGAFKLGREWRVPLSAVAVFDASGPAPAVPKPARRAIRGRRSR